MPKDALQKESCLIGRALDYASERFERFGDTVNTALREPVIRLGVTGLSTAGKTVFITSLVENLRNRDRLLQFRPVAEGRLEAAFLQPQPNETLPRFSFENHLATLTDTPPSWPQSTRTISQLRLSFRVRPNGLLSGLSAPRNVHLDIVDYPGEWLLDLPLLDKSFDEWSSEALAAMQIGRRKSHGADFLSALGNFDPAEPLEEAKAQKLASIFTRYLRVAKADGLSSLAPGRFLMPGDLDGSPAMTFFPIAGGPYKRGSFGHQITRRFEAYKSKVVLPFFRDHFAKLDRQIVLIDVLSALHQGPIAVADMQTALTDILACFKTGRNTVFSRLFARRIDKILFAATKADHIHHTQHPALDSLIQAMVRDAKDQSEYKGAQTRSMALASFRTTTEAKRRVDNTELSVVEGRLEEGEVLGASFPGRLPNDPRSILTQAQSGKPDWTDFDFALQAFLPPLSKKDTMPGLPNIRMDQAIEFLIGDRL
ncbi:MAG: YcjX family protein [Pseudomonadota bacterium]